MNPIAQNEEIIKKYLEGISTFELSKLFNRKTSSINRMLRNKGIDVPITKYRHGYSQESEYKQMYNTWHSMRSRCNNPLYSQYKNYGGKGIIVCEEWDNFNNFKDWSLNNGYQKNLTIDRINSEKNYEPNNCQWLSRSENSKKRDKDTKKAREIKGKIKLTWEQIDFIREHIELSGSQLSKMFNTVPTNIFHIRNNRTWNNFESK